MLLAPFFVAPGLVHIAIYVGAAVLPALFLMRYIYRMDTVEKEPGGLLWGLFLRGGLAAVVAVVLELVGEWVLDIFLAEGSALYVAATAFLVVAVSEEWAKFFFLRRRTWNEPNFDYRFDGVVYAAFVSLGFAAFENIGYVFSYGLSVAGPRAVLSVPGHMGFSVFMGAFYGRARECANYGDEVGARWYNRLGVVIAAALHGLYDFCAMLDTDGSTAFFLLFVAVMYIVVLRTVKRESRTDRRI